MLNVNEKNKFYLVYNDFNACDRLIKILKEYSIKDVYMKNN